jgi:ribosome biogenesis GTPase / thiamine phosphate phosphatase
MEEGERSASIAGRLMRPDGGRRGPAGPTRPVVGDWVAVHLTPEGGARIDQVLPRRTTLSRKEPGRRTNEQVVAANVDLVLVVMAMDADFSERRLERLLTIVRHGGAAPAVLLSKSDLSGDAESMCGKARTAAPGVAVHAVSCLSGNGLDTVRALLPARKTAALIGSSGVGKSTLINRLLGAQVQATQHVIEDGRGRHTTTHRELFRLPGGALLIDNPGLREVQLWADAGSLSHAFSDVAGLATGCRFRDCSHGTEPGCAVRAAADGGDLDPARLRSFHALQAELRSAAIRRDALARREETRRWRSVHKALRRSRKW